MKYSPDVMKFTNTEIRAFGDGFFGMFLDRQEQRKNMFVPKQL